MAKQGLYQFVANDTAAQFVLADGTSIDVRVADLTPDVQRALMWHGLKQKVVDGAAIPRNTETGRSASDADKIAAMRAIAERLLAGEWSARTGEGGSGGPKGLLQRALERLFPNASPEAIAERIAGMSAKEQSALRMSPKVASIIAGLRDEAAARKGKSVNTDELLADLGTAYTPGTTVL